MSATVYQPEVLFRDGKTVFGGELVVGDSGDILATAPADATVVKLPGRGIFPGLVNAHSHAFQRVLRGRTEFVASGKAADDFWSWREAMYLAATSLTPEEVEVASRQAFVEMAISGITSVGEFHYLHHQPDGTPYADVHQLAKRVISAARSVGLRIALLRVGYARSGFQVERNPRQARFIEADVQTYLSRADDLRSAMRGDGLVSVGLAPHSVRAVPRAWLEAVAKISGVVHLHVAEQPAELRACQAEHGKSPVELLADVGLLSARMTAVHGVHLSERDVALLASSGASVCACPTTEANLGDGVVPADQLLAAGVSISLGSDSQARIDLLEEARLLEGDLRLLRQRRAVLAAHDGRQTGLGEYLLGCATTGGARSLGLDVGALTAGQPADFFTVDLSHPSLVGSPPASLAFAATGGVIEDVAVQGRFIVRDGQHALLDSSRVEFGRLMKRLQS